jgi:hypothetical protein
MSISHILLVLALYVLFRRWFERTQPQRIRRLLKRRRDALPRFKDVWDQNKYLRTLSSRQRRRYYRDKGGYNMYVFLHDGVILDHLTHHPLNAEIHAERPR